MIHVVAESIGERGKDESSLACVHEALIVRWERDEDMGNEELVAGYACTECGKSFTLEEAPATGKVARRIWKP